MSQQLIERTLEEDVAPSLFDRLLSETTLPVESVGMVRFDGPPALSITCVDRHGPLVVTLRPSTRSWNFDLVDGNWETYLYQGQNMKSLTLGRAIEFAILILERETKW